MRVWIDVNISKTGISALPRLKSTQCVIPELFKLLAAFRTFSRDYCGKFCNVQHKKKHIYHTQSFRKQLAIVASPPRNDQTEGTSAKASLEDVDFPLKYILAV